MTKSKKKRKHSEEANSSRKSDRKAEENSHENTRKIQNGGSKETGACSSPDNQHETVSEALSKVNHLLYGQTSGLIDMSYYPVAPTGHSPTPTFQQSVGQPQPLHPTGPQTSAPMYTNPGVYTSQSAVQPTHMQNTGQSAFSPVMAAIQALEFKIDARFADVCNRLEKLDRVEKRVNEIDEVIKSLRVEVTKRIDKMEDRVTRNEDRCDNADFALGSIDSRMGHLESQNNRLKDELVDMQARSMRENLIFKGIPETDTETTEDLENKLKKIFTEKLQLADVLVEQMKFERVHRFGSFQYKPRRIVARFSSFKDREEVRRNAKHLKGSDIFIQEQFPAEIMEVRRRLWPEFKRCRDNGTPCRLTYDKLFINGVRFFPRN